MTPRFDVIVCGGGLAGAAAALAAGRSAKNVALIAPQNPIPDGRTTALMMPSVRFLKQLGIDSDFLEQAAPLKTMRIMDDTGRLLRPPPLTFRAQEISEEAFGYNILNGELQKILMHALHNEERVTVFEVAAEKITHEEDGVRVALEDGAQLDGSILAGSDGRNSLVRRSAGISSRSWSYPQTAIVLNFDHEYDHDDTSNEFHTPAGPFTQVPLGRHRSSLVWAMSPPDADERKQDTDDVLGQHVEERLHSMLGKVKITSERGFFPFSGLIANQFGKGRSVLLGEAGHVFPPIGAQGFNLGLRDVSIFMDLLRQYGTGGESKIGDAFDRGRRSDVGSRTYGVDILNRSLLNGFLPVQMARYAGMTALAHIPPLRAFAMREGMSPGQSMLSGAAKRHQGFG
ncbi:UbiH/UbiF family hydroxylase [Hoeflea sp. WL0058]|uniref:UbiH/UbiF family hydroxylase n=1 Tax=Flavimaribacter sediminis TaxID=2865987 RepID=A0AAE3D0G8_9HYPH|nr:UbiH/UbiF family hydroxylase [Flavimaribacter sediminis]MBW8637012.1 UbiH/UbiF family hydroxylase [Flavimaribacter sediminis]